MASFPLRCTVCPKDPKFSDVSHLLTHIASKGHLSHYFKIQVRSRSDPAVAQKLRAYDRWYLQHDVERLLSQRMLQKDTKRAGGRTSTLATSARARYARSRPQGSTDNATGDGRINSLIDPALPRPGSASSAPALLPSTPTPKREPSIRQAALLRGPIWEQGTRESEVPTGPGYRQQLQERLTAAMDGSWEPRTAFREIRHPSHCSHAHGSTSDLTERTSSDGTCSTADSTWPPHGDGEEPEAQGDGAKLKGIIWPGMDLFDSASLDARRKRNQKKETGVLEAMQAQSEQVEPTEVIYFPSWDVKKSRFISGEVESSPPSSVSPKKRQRPRTFRPPLLELDTNRRTTRQGPKLRSDVQRSPARLPTGSTRMRSLLSQPQQPHPLMSHDDEVERRLDYGESRQHPFPKLEVFDDRNGFNRGLGSANGGSGRELARNPLNAMSSRESRNSPDPFAPVQAQGMAFLPHGLSGRASISNGADLFQTRHQFMNGFRHDGIHSMQAPDFGLYHLPQHYQPPRSSTANALYLGMPENDPGIVHRLAVHQTNANPLAQGNSNRNPDPGRAQSSLPWDHRPCLPVGYCAPSNNRQTSSASQPDESSGDETIDQGIDDCLDFFGA